MGVDAAEATVKKAKLDNYRVVYFATHAETLKNLPKSKQNSLSR